MGQDYQYSGKDTLDLMALAVNYNRAILEWLTRDLPDKSLILDFGAGKGEYCNRFPPGRITAVEPDEDMHNGIRCRAVKSLTELKGKFDMIYAVNVLEHIRDDQAIVGQLSGLLSGTGIMKIFVPARQELYSTMDEKVGHERRYSMAGLSRLFTSQGLIITNRRYFDILGYIIAMVFKCLKRDDSFNATTVRLYDRLIFPVSSLLDTVTCGKVIGKNIMLEARKQVNR